MKKLASVLCGLLLASSAWATDVLPTPNSVVASAGATAVDGTAGATILAGDVLYLDTAAGTMKLCDADASASASVVAGIALNDAASGQPVRYVTYDPALVIGFVPTPGAAYFTSENAGNIADATDSGSYTTVLGVGKSATTIYFKPISAAVAKP